MEKGYYYLLRFIKRMGEWKSQSTIKMEKGYYWSSYIYSKPVANVVAIHNKNGKGLLHVEWVILT